MVLTLLDTLNGFFSLIFVCVSISVGLRIANKYHQVKSRDYLLIGIGWAGISSAWWSSVISFILILITGYGLNELFYFLIALAFLPIFATFLLIGFTEITLPRKQKIIVGIWIIIMIVYEILLFYYLFTDITVIGELKGPLDATYRNFVMIYLIFLIVVLYTFCIIFSINAIKSDDSEIKFKGKMLILAYTTYLVGSLMDSAIPLNEITLILTRVILILSCFFVYIGFLLPNWAKNFFKIK